MRSRDLCLMLALAATAVAAPAPEAAKEPGGQPFDLGGLGGGNRKDPITITSDTLEFDYKANIVTYRGNVLAVQGDVKVKSDVLVIVLAGRPAGATKTERGKKTETAPGAAATEPTTTTTTTTLPEKPAGAAGSAADKVSLQTVTATGNVRIDQGARWATGGMAVFDQTKRTFVLSQKPVLHEAQNEVSGERIVVYLDENRSIVEGGPSKRVQAILYPDKGGGLAGEAKPPAKNPTTTTTTAP